MVQYQFSLDDIFHSLADSTRRDILMRVNKSALTITELAEEYDMSFSAVAKHLRVLEKAKLVFKQKNGKQRIIVANPDHINEALQHLELYKQQVNERFIALDDLLTREDSS